MAYFLGIDLGTTYTAAAISREGSASVVNLGNRAPVVPSVVLLRDDESILTGEAAVRRAATEPQRVAREFKRRMGDPTPIIVGGSPYSADALTASLLRWVVEKVTEVEGSPPTGIAVSYPSNWGEYKQDLLRQAIARADLDGVVMVTEPEAAAIHYASQERVEAGSVIAVYDLGGGTFDVAVLRKTESGWEVLGEPQGIDRLGGIDVDEAVFRHVVDATDGVITELDPDDPAALAAVARLRQECVEAKEALSSDTDVLIPVLLPNLQTEVRLTRAELEQMVRPALADTITTMGRALRSAGVEPEQVDTVLLVGGSSRIPLVAQLVGSALSRPVAVDAHPKHGIALGAAMVAAEADRAGTGPVAAPLPPPPVAPPVAAPVPPPPVAPPPVTAPPTPPPVAAQPTEPDPVVAASPPAPILDPPRGRSGPPLGLIAAAVLAVLVVAVVAVAALGGGDDDDVVAAEPVGNEAPAATTAPPAEDTSTTSVTAAPPVEDTSTTDRAYDDAIRANFIDACVVEGTPDGCERVLQCIEGQLTQAEFIQEEAEATATGVMSDRLSDVVSDCLARATAPVPDGPFVALDAVVVDGGLYRVSYEVFGFEPRIDGGPDSLHLHLFLDTTAPENAGVDGNPPGEWYITDAPSTDVTSFGPANRGAATQMCVVVANVDHSVHDPESGTCVALPDS